MRKAFGKVLMALLIAALLLAPTAMMEEIAPEPVDAPVEVSDSVELPDEIGGEKLESQADYVAEGDASTGPYTFTAHPGPESGITVKTYVNGVEVTSADAGAQVTMVCVLSSPTITITGVVFGASTGPVESQVGADGAYTFTMPASNVEFYISYIKGSGGAGTPDTPGTPDDPSLTDENSIPIDEDHFPDPAFRQFLLSYFGGGSVARISKDRCEQCTMLTLAIFSRGQSPQGYGITSLKGIEYFPNLEILTCSYNPIDPASLVYLQGMTKLRTLDMTDCGMTSLDASLLASLGKLTFLGLDNNQIAALDITPLKSMAWLRCSNNGMTSLNVTGLSKLQQLWCDNNQLTSLDLTGCKKIHQLYIHHNPIARVNVAPCKPIMKHWSKLIRKSHNKAGYISLVYYNKNADPQYTDYVQYSKGTKIATKGGSSSSSETTPTEPAAFTNTSEDMTVTVDASSTAKNTVATVVAPAGSTTQLDLNGATGKKFKSSNKNVVTVDKNGVVTVKGSGKVKITYKVGKKTRKVTLNVTDPTFPTGIALNLPATAEAKVGESQTLTATLNEGAVSDVKWKSSKKKIATVDANGVVTFKKAGKVKITATTTRGKKKASVTFKVTK